MPALRTPHRYRPVSALGRASAAALPTERPLRVVSWNLQFCGGRREPYFYEGGPAVHVAPADQARAFAGVVEVLRRLDADVVLLQEVDRGSDRTNRRDQLADLLASLPGHAAVSAAVHRNRFVPHPPHRFLGRMDLHLAILARAPLFRPTRQPLPGLREPRLRAHFNLHRALLTAEVPLATGRVLTLGNTHLSAFSGGDDTLVRQLSVLDAWLGAAPSPALLGGDFNLLPPGDPPSRLPTDRADHPVDRAAIDPFFARYESVLPPDGQRAPTAGTYIPPGASVPDRTLDWIFLGGGLRTRAARVEPIDPFISDHLPVVAELGSLTPR